MLQFNPFTAIFVDPSDESSWVIQAPLPGVGLQRRRVTKTKFPELFRQCEAVGEGAIRVVDPQSDLNEKDRDELCKAGILVDGGVEAKDILFSCLLDSLEIFPFSTLDGYVVEPSLRPEPFDLTRFSTWAGERRLSPYRPSLWITDRDTGYRSGYWLDPSDFSVFESAVAGAPPPDHISRDLAGRAITAGILVESHQNGRRGNDLVAEAADFKDSGYAVIRNVIPAAQIGAVQAYFREVENEGFMTRGDNLVERRFVAPMEPFARNIHDDLTKLMCTLAGATVQPSYCYVSSYFDGAVLRPHTDRPQCEFSFSLQLDYSPIEKGQLSPWPLCLRPSDGRDVEVHLAPGDLLAYRGCEITHWRPALPPGHRSSSLFLHYVGLDFEGSLI